MPGKTASSQQVRWLVKPAAVESLSAERGAYALLIRLERHFRGSVGALGTVGLPAGTYLYCGSANGPGGLRARLRRHLRRDKSLHWHVDHLTTAGTITRILAVAGGRECALVSRALRLPDVSTPAAGFGSSDCRRCFAHLLGVRDGDGVVDALRCGGSARSIQFTSQREIQ